MKARGVTGSLFDEAVEQAPPSREPLAEGAFLLRGFALDVEKELRSALDRIVAAAPFRHMVTPGGYRMSVSMTNCGGFGWITDRRGYRYDALDPDSGQDICLPPSRALLADLCAARWKMSVSGIQLESKDDIKRRLGRSPDLADSIAYALYQEVPKQSARWIHIPGLFDR